MTDHVETCPCIECQTKRSFVEVTQDRSRGKWVDLDDLRREIAADAKARAMAAGLEGVRVSVRIAEPDRRGGRVIDVSVALTRKK